MTDRVEVNGVSIPFLKRGDGPPMLLLHGPGFPLTIWRENIESLSKYFSIYAFDLPRLQEPSTSTFPTDTLENYAEIVYVAMGSLNIERAHLVGFSVGGAIAALLSRLHPEKVNRLVLISAVGLNKENGVKTTLGHTKNAPEEQTRSSAGLQTGLSNEADVSDSEKLERLEIESLLRRPVLMVTGERDTVRREAVCSIVARNPLAKCAIVADAGQYPQEEKPEAVNRQIIPYCLEVPVNTFCG